MAGPLYCVINLAGATGATVTADYEQTNFPDENLTNQRSGKPWQSTTTFFTDGTQNIDIDLGAVGSVDFLALHNHNLDAGGTYTLESDDNDNGSYTATTTQITLTHRTADMYGTIASPVSKQYWRLKLVDTTSLKPKIGELVLGASTQLTRSYRWGQTWQKRYTNRVIMTEARYPWTYKISKNRSWMLSWGGLSQSQLDELETLLDATTGNATPFTFVPEPDSTDTDRAANVYYVRFVEEAFDLIYSGPGNRSLGGVVLEELPVETSA